MYISQIERSIRKILDERFVDRIEMKAYQISIEDIFPKKFIAHTVGFNYSVEVEVFSKSKPLFTYPAISLLYESNNGLSIVHACSRIYNDDESMIDPILMSPQIGYDVFIESCRRNYFIAIGGSNDSYSLCITLSPKIGQELIRDIEFKSSSIGSMRCFYLEDIFQGEVSQGEYRVSIKHNFRDVFPRFYCGQVELNGQPTLTHTFFDTSGEIDNIDLTENVSVSFMSPVNDDFYNSVFSFPIPPVNKFTTEIVSYSSNKAFSGQALVEIFS